MTSPAAELLACAHRLADNPETTRHELVRAGLLIGMQLRQMDEETANDLAGMLEDIAAAQDTAIVLSALGMTDDELDALQGEGSDD